MQMMIRILFVLCAVVFSVTSDAQSDFEIARSFMSGKGVVLSEGEASGNRAPGDKCYSVFHAEDGNGFAIVKDGVVFGYSTEGSVDEEDMPPALKSMLKYSNAYEWKPTPCEPVEPLIKVKWGQGNRYIYPIYNSPAGCSNVAIAMILHYWKYPKVFPKFNGAYGVYRGVEYHLGPLDEYRPDYDAMGMYTNHTEGLGAELAEELIMHVGLRDTTVYTPYGSYLTRPVCEAFVDTWGYKYTFDGRVNVFGEVQNYQISGCGEDFYKYIHRHTKQGHPLMAVGGSKDDSWHAYVIDGMDEDGRYHVNYGWGTSANGYYISGPMNRKDFDWSQKDVDRFSYNLTIRAIIPDDDEYVRQVLTDVSTVPVNGRDNDDAVYSISGQKMGDSLDRLPKGIYVKGGAKYVVK